MLAPATLETVLELAAEAGGSAMPARAKLGLGGDVASTTATTLEMAEAVSAFHFPDDVWARVIYDLVVAARNPAPSARDAGRGARPDLLRSGRLASSSRTAHVTTEQAEDRVERQAREFELLKPYLVGRWNARRRDRASRPRRMSRP